MTNRQLQNQLRDLLKSSGAEIGDLHRIFWKVLVDYETEIGWDAPNKNASWTDDQLRVILSEAPTQETA